MAKQKPEDIRNVVFLGHGGSGKTTVVDEFLHAAGANSRIGSVKDGTSLVDTADDEVEGKASIDLHLLHCTYQGKLFHLLDTPGRTDFIGQTVAALRAAESALIHVDGYTGIQVNTRKAWKMAREEGKAVAFVVTKVDMENVDLPKLIKALQETFGKCCVPFNLPDVTGAGLAKVLSVLNPPEGASDFVKGYREPLIESIVESNEELMMRYLEGEDVSAEVVSHIGTAIQAGSLVPVLCYGQKGSVGVKELLDALVGFFPSAASIRSLPVVRKVENEAGESSTEIAPVDIDSNTFVAQVVKTVIDEHKGRMAIMRVFSGSIVAGATYTNASRGRGGKFGKLFKFFGTKQEEVDSVSAGDIFAAAKIEELSTGETVTDGTWKEPVRPLRFPMAMVALAIKPKSRADESRISQVLQRYMAEDPTFRFEMDSQTKEMVVYGMSELHLNILLQRMARRQNVHVDTKLPRISYRETITRSVSDFYRHKKQSGGSGEFAEVHFRMNPYRGKEDLFNFVDALRGDNVRRQFVPSVEKGCRSMCETGVLTGSPVIWVEVEFFDGKDHPVDGKDMAFQKAARECFKKCFLQAGPTLLEPTVNLEVSIPPEFAGDISQYLNSHRGRIQGMDHQGEEQIVRALIPLAEVQTFSSDLRAMTQGQGNYSMEFASYDQVPSQVQQQIIDKYAKEAHGEEE